MNDHVLKMFIKVADIGSFTKAANDSYLTVSALVKQINQLEENLGFKLFTRTNHGVELTEAGKSYYDDVKFMLNYMESSKKKAEMKQYEYNQYIIRMGVTSFTPVTLFSKIWNQLGDKVSSYQINLIPLENNMLNAEITLNNFGSNIDCIVDFYDENMLNKYHCQSLELSKLKIKAAIPNNHRLYDCDYINISDLEGETVILYYTDEHKFFKEARNKLNNYKNINIIDYMDINLDLYNEAMNNNYIALTFEIWKDVHPFMKIVDIDWDLYLPYGLLYSNNPSMKIKNMIHILKDALY